MSDIIIAPSILAANFAQLGQEVTHIDKAGADWVHLDVMDGHFVPNISFGPAIIKDLRPYTAKTFDCHLMISPVDCYIDEFANAGADIITVHLEATHHIERTITHIKSLGKKAGISLNPATPIEGLQYLLDKIDLILIMSVNPGFGGQKFIPAMLDKIQKVKHMIGARDIIIEVDGGITNETTPAVIQAGASALVAGSFVFKGNTIEDYAHNIAKLRP